MALSAARKLNLTQGNQISRRHSIRKHYMICLRSLDGHAVKREHEFLCFHLRLARLILGVLVDIKAGLSLCHLRVVVDEDVPAQERSPQEYCLILDVDDRHFLPRRRCSGK